MNVLTQVNKQLLELHKYDNNNNNKTKHWPLLRQPDLVVQLIVLQSFSSVGPGSILAMEVYFPLRKINEVWPQWYALGDKRLVQLCGCPNRTLRQLCGCPKDRKDRRP